VGISYISVYAYTVIMATRTISIREEVYDVLKSLKRENESFSDVIGKLAKKRKSDLREYFGVLKDSKVLNEIEEDTRKIRAATRQRI
jgi:predicted CopG family antitoxin